VRRCATLCDDCFLSMLTARMNSSYLAESQFNIYLSAELGEVLEYCGQDTNLTLNAYTSYTTTTAVSTTATSSSTSVAALTCTGQVVTAAKLKQRQLLSGFSAYGNITTQCQDISQQYNVPTGSVLIASGNSDCNTTASMCLPPACELQQVGQDENTCVSLASGLTVAGSNVTMTQLLAWNPLIIGTCDSLQVGQYICIT